MSYIKIDSNNTVISIHNYPLHPIWGLGKTEAELLKEGYFIEHIPPADTLEGKCAILKYNPTTKYVYYEYIDALPTPKTEMELLKEEMELQKQTILELSMMVSGGAV